MLSRRTYHFHLEDALGLQSNTVSAAENVIYTIHWCSLPPLIILDLPNIPRQEIIASHIHRWTFSKSVTKQQFTFVWFLLTIHVITFSGRYSYMPHRSAKLSARIFFEASSRLYFLELAVLFPRISRAKLNGTS